MRRRTPTARDSAEAVFLVVGALGLSVLLLSLVVGEVGDLGDADGPFSVPAVAALLGGVGFGGAAAATLLPETLPDAGRALLALVAGLLLAVPLAWAAVRLSAGCATCRPPRPSPGPTWPAPRAS